MGPQGRRRLSCVCRGASVSLTADRRRQLSGMDAAPIEGDHLWREFLGAVSDQFQIGRFALPTMIYLENSVVVKVLWRVRSATNRLFFKRG